MDYSEELTFQKDTNEQYWVINIMKGQDTLKISYEHNFDLYWTFISDCNNKFTISQENYELYKVFDKLYQRIKHYQIFEPATEEEKNDINKLNESHKEQSRKLYNEETGIIEWFCDDCCKEKANSVRIIPGEDKYELEFVRRRNNSSCITPIRFRNIGSRYNPLNTLFCKHYNELCDVDDQVHQISLGEVAYRMKVKL